MVERPKKGFNIPIAEWLKGPLRSWAADLLSGERLRREGFLDEKFVGGKWTEHLEGRRDWGLPLWHILMFQAWLAEQQPKRQLLEEVFEDRTPLSESVRLQTANHANLISANPENARRAMQ